MLKRVVFILALGASASAQPAKNDYSAKTRLCQAMGNLVDVVGQQARAYLRANRKSQ